MTTKLTDEERAAMLTRVRVFWCQELHADYWTNEEVAEISAKEVERDREQRAGDGAAEQERWRPIGDELKRHIPELGDTGDPARVLYAARCVVDDREGARCRAAAAELSRMEWQKLAGERFDQIAAMHCKLADVANLCRSLLVEDIDGSNGFAKAQKLAARVLEIVGEQQKEAAK